MTIITECLSEKISPEKIISLIKNLDMTAEVKSISNTVYDRIKRTDTTLHQAAILDVVNLHTNTLTLHYTDFGNISIKTPHTAKSAELYSVPGHSILFAINNQSFTVQLYRITEEQLTIKERVTISENNPLVIDGRHTLFEYIPSDSGNPAFIGSINLPDLTADICVFNRDSLRKIAWFPHDDSAARYLVSLELLESIQDPGACKVAEELIYHYHPAVAWRAFQVIYQKDPLAAPNYVPLLRQLKNSHMDHLLDQYSEVI